MTTDSKTRGFGGGGWMRGLAVVGLVVAGGLMQGCIIETSSNPPASCDSNITVKWFISAANITRSCAEVGGKTVSMLVDDDTMIVDFPCTALAGTTPLVQGNRTHTIAMQLTDASGNVLSQLDPVAIPVGCGVVADVGTVEFSLTQ
jgi:hypothetical protein